MVSQKNYRVDSFVSDLSIKAPVVLVTTANVVLLSGAQTIETVVLSIGDRVLLNAQTAAKDNGIYTVEQAAWNRAGDWDGNRDAANGTLIISTQNGNAELYELQTVDDPFEPGADDAAFVKLAPNDSEDGTFTINWAGFTTAVQSTATYRKVGNLVLLRIHDGVVVGTSNAVTKQSTAGDLPASIIPSVAQIIGMCKTADNGGLFEFGTVEISPTGAEIRIFRNVLSTLWTASGGATINAHNLVYYL